MVNIVVFDVILAHLERRMRTGVRAAVAQWAVAALGNPQQVAGRGRAGTGV